MFTSTKKTSLSLEPSNESGYFSRVVCQVSNLRPDMLTMSRSSSAFCLDVTAGGGGRGLVAMGTQPMAAALANGSHAATEAMLLGAMVQVTDSWMKLPSLSSGKPPILSRQRHFENSAVTTMTFSFTWNHVVVGSSPGWNTTSVGRTQFQERVSR